MLTNSKSIRILDRRIWSREGKAKKTLESLDFDCIDVLSRVDGAVDFQLSLDCGIDPVDIIILVVGDRYGDNLIDVLHKIVYQTFPKHNLLLLDICRGVAFGRLFIWQNLYFISKCYALPRI